MPILFWHLFCQDNTTKKDIARCPFFVGCRADLEPCTSSGSRRRRREWVGKQKHHGAVFLCSRNRQIKELKKQSAIATRNEYDLVEGYEKSHLRNQKIQLVRVGFFHLCR